MKTIRSKIFPIGILSLIETKRGFWAVRRHYNCPNCDWKPIRKLATSREDPRAEFDQMTQYTLRDEVVSSDDLWEWIMGHEPGEIGSIRTP